MSKFEQVGGGRAGARARGPYVDWRGAGPGPNDQV